MVLLVAAWCAPSPSNAATIGVLSDERQVEELSLLYANSAARVALDADGHAIVTLGPGSLDNLSVMQTVDIVWLPLLQTTAAYTVQERTNLVLYVSVHGGRIVWIGDADPYNASDDSFLSAFGMNKLRGNFGDSLSPALPSHPVVSGPHGPISAIGTNASYGLFNSRDDVADVFVGAPGPGAVVGLMDAGSGYDGNGRAAFVCDSTMFSQLLLSDNHRELLRNIVKWAAAEPSYTPTGTDVTAGPLAGACDACTSVSVLFETVTSTGETSVASIGAGRCYFDDIAPAALPPNFLGYAFDIETTAVGPTPNALDVTVAYDPAELAALGVADESLLQLFWYDADGAACTNVTAVQDMQVHTIAAHVGELGVFLLGAPVEATDCNDNGMPDACEIDRDSPASGGPFYCQDDCDPDCNNNGVPDACDIDGGTSPDCNANAVPDECEPDVVLTFASDPTGGGTTTPEGAVEYDVCEIVPILATPSEGYCFTNWTVNAGAAPDDPDAAQTTIAVDVDKTVTAHFTEIITQQPADASVCEGLEASFSIQIAEIASAGATYRWRVNHGGGLVDLADDETVSGSATADLHISPVSVAYAGTYVCVVTSDCGAATSDSATLAVGLNPQITQQPTDVAICPGLSAPFSIVATGTGLTYQWQYSPDGLAFGDLVNDAGTTGVQTATLTISNVTQARAGQYRCIVIGACGLPVASEPAQLTVYQILQFAGGPANQFACPGEAVSFSVDASGTNLVFQWQYSAGGPFANLIDGDGIAGATTATLEIANVQAVHAGQYRCVISGICGGAVTTDAASLAVGVEPFIAQQPADVFACLGFAATFTISANASGRALRWQFDDGGGFEDLIDGGAVSGATTPTLTINPATHVHAGHYRCVVSGDCGQPVYSTSAALTVGEAAVLTGQPSSLELCEGAGASFFVQATGSNVSYLWQFNDGPSFATLVDDGNITGAATAALSIAVVGPSHVGFYRCIVFGACGPSVTSNEASLTLPPGACDCNGNGVLDADDLAGGTSQDCNTNNVPDECDLANGTAQDCNANGIPDSCDMAAGASDDCNANGVPDECDPPYVADAGEPFTVCVGTVSQPMGGPVVATGSNSPYTYVWHVVSGPPDGGSLLDPTSERPRFLATLPGDYVIELQVSDASHPPCVTTDSVAVIALQVIADAGPDVVMCAEGVSDPLTPSAAGGTPPYTYQWSVVAGSQNTSRSQFTGAGPDCESPTFTPAEPGWYTLRVTVTDSSDPSCAATDTLSLRAAALQLAAGDDFAMCAGAQSAPLSVTLIAPGTAPLTYSWTIESGPHLSASQFTGSGPASPSPTFQPAAIGEYVLRVSVQDSAAPPCQVGDTLHVSVGSMSVDAGAETSLCVGSQGLRLSPMIDGGHGSLSYSWTIEPGSPSTDPIQFTDPHAFDATPLFVPSAVGNYRLRLTVTDSATPACTATDILVVRATSMIVDAGEDFTTRSFQPSRGLGALPLVGGGDPPYMYAWEIVGGPDRSPAQLSAADVEHPRLTPMSVGTYELRVTVTDANGLGCAITDTVVVEAIASELRVPINAEGRLFMNLQVDAASTRAELRMSHATPGKMVEGRLAFDDNAVLSGLDGIPSVRRRLSSSSVMSAGAYLAVVAIYYADDELAGIDARDLRLVWFDSSQQAWYPAGARDSEIGPFPLRPEYADLNRRGVDPSSRCVWAVLDYLADFSIGVPSLLPPAAQPNGSSAASSSSSSQAAAAQSIEAQAPEMCGAVGSCGAGSLLPLTAAGATVMTRMRRRQSGDRRPSTARRRSNAQGVSS